jgi:hypothetical protein
MDHLRTLVNLFKDQHPDLKAHEDLFKHLEETFLSPLLRVIQRDATLFDEFELFPGRKVTWVDDDEHWKRFHLALMYSVLRGDPKEKFGKIFETVKGMMPGGSTQADEIQKLLDDEETQSSLSELLELVMSTRLLTLVGEIMQSVSFDDLNLDLENPESILELLRNPSESTALTTLMERAKAVLEDRIKSGKINQAELQRDIELVRAKFQSAFGKYINEQVLGVQGNTTGNTGAQILSNHPEARRARMMARLQKKQKEKARK